MFSFRFCAHPDLAKAGFTIISFLLERQCDPVVSALQESLEQLWSAVACQRASHWFKSGEGFFLL